MDWLHFHEFISQWENVITTATLMYVMTVKSYFIYKTHSLIINYNRERAAEQWGVKGGAERGSQGDNEEIIKWGISDWQDFTTLCVIMPRATPTPGTTKHAQNIYLLQTRCGLYTWTCSHHPSTYRVGGFDVDVTTVDLVK